MNPAVLRQLLSGMELPFDPPTCSHCFGRLRESARIGVVARKPYGVGCWGINSTFCQEHTPDTVPRVPNGSSALAHAEVGSLVDTGRQTHTPALLSVEIVDHALDNDTDNDIGCAPIRVAEEDGGVAR